MTESHRLTYTGNPAFSGVLVQMLQDEGLAVEWEPPEERRGANIPEDVLVGLVVSGLSDTIKLGIRTAIEKFRTRFPGRAEVRDDDASEDDE